MRNTWKKLMYGFRIWRLYLRYRLSGGKNRKVIDKLNQTYIDYFYFLENTADTRTQEGQTQLWRARALREELDAEGENFWKRA